MNDTKHTPGPWTVKEDRLPSSLEVFSGKTAICEIWRRADSEKEKADSELIASAPEMYTALLRCVHQLKLAGHDRISANEVIAEAELALKKAGGGR